MDAWAIYLSAGFAAAGLLLGWGIESGLKAIAKTIESGLKAIAKAIEGRKC